jgi:predicted N-acetyltransferase YhbS
MAEGVVIRPEREADHRAIAEVVRAAFVRHPDEVESFVERIRASEQFIPELALVAEDGQTLKVGYFRCTSRVAGLTCLSRHSGHGFFLSNKRQRTF